MEVENSKVPKGLLKGSIIIEDILEDSFIFNHISVRKRSGSLRHGEEKDHKISRTIAPADALRAAWF